MLPKGRDFCGKKFLQNLFLRITNAPNLVTLAKRFFAEMSLFSCKLWDLFSWTTSNWKLDRKLNAHYHSNPRHSDFPDFFFPLPRPLYSAVKTHKKCSWWPLLFENKILGLFQVFQLIRKFFQIYVFFWVFLAAHSTTKGLVTLFSQCQGQTISVNIIN